MLAMEMRRGEMRGNQEKEVKKMRSEQFEEEIEKAFERARGGNTMRIMVPIDGTPECEEAVPLAARMAEGFGADVYLVRVVEAIDAFSPLRAEPEIAAMVKDTRSYLHDLVYRWELPAEQTQCLVNHTDNVGKDLIELAKTHKIDLVVMATHGRKGISRWTQGNVCDEMIRSKVCPVVVIPAQAVEEVGGRRIRWYERIPVPARGVKSGTGRTMELAKK